MLRLMSKCGCFMALLLKLYPKYVPRASTEVSAEKMLLYMAKEFVSIANSIGMKTI